MPFRAQFNESWTAAYREVNEIFAETMVPYVEDGDSIWIHDYHLLLLPRILRERLKSKKNVRIGLFLHTAFPREDAFSILPLREAICDGLMSSDLVGFHVREYVEIFLDSAENTLTDVRRSPSDLHYQDRKMVVSDFPIGINPDEVRGMLSAKATQKEIASLTETFQGRKILLGVDRLDYIKGVPLKLLAFDTLLENHPEWVGKVIMIQLAIPTRSTVKEYKALRKEVEELVGRINGKHGTLNYTPVQYLYKSLNPSQLYALYSVSDLCVVSSVRDGLNMVSYEYVASQADGNGVLLLSQYTGAAKLLHSALQFNPWDLPRFTDAILTALDMQQEERKRRMDESREVVETWTSMKWGSSFLEALRSEF